jgi:alpha-amylase
MRSICLSFQVHQPYRLRTYRFFNIGDDHQYYDDYQNRHFIRRIAEKSYVPANKMLLELIREYGKAFKVSFAVSGPALEQLEVHAPEVIQGFRELAATGCVEFLAETWSHSLVSLRNKEEFQRQVEQHRQRMSDLFKQVPTTFVNTEMIYTDQIGQDVAEMGFTAMMTEGAKHIMGWKSPNFVYCNSINPKLKVLLRNFRLSDDIIFRFSNRSWSEWPLTTEKFVKWLNALDKNEEVVNIALAYETLGTQQSKETGIFDFFRSLPKAVLGHTGFTFSTPAGVAAQHQTVSKIGVQDPISWADEEKDLTAWLGNELQDEAFSKIYSIGDKVLSSGRPDILRDWERLQISDHFYYMSTKWFTDGDVSKYFNPYPSPYEAFINYMNVLSDLMIRLETPSAGAAAKKEKSPAKKAAKPSAKKTVKPAPKKPAKTAPEAKSKAVKEPRKITFNDIVNLSDKKVKELIKKSDSGSLFLALKGAKEEVRDKILKNFGVRAMSKFESFSAELRKAKPAEVKKSRELIEKLLN